MRLTIPVPPVGPPTPDAAREIGLALLGNICAAYQEHCGWALLRMPYGGFALRTWKRGSPYVRRVGHSSHLTDILRHQGGPDELTVDQRRKLGLPVTDAEVATVGALATALFAIQEGSVIALWLDFRPWAPAHLRYRLRPGFNVAGEQVWHRLRAAGLESLLAAGSAYLGSQPRR